jgi:hypothetical protein
VTIGIACAAAAAGTEKANLIVYKSILTEYPAVDKDLTVQIQIFNVGERYNFHS